MSWVNNLCDPKSLQDGRGCRRRGPRLLPAQWLCAQREVTPKELVGWGVRTKTLDGLGQVWDTAARANG